MDELESWVFDEQKVVTYRWLALITSIPSNFAKKQLYTFWKKYPDRITPTFFVCGYKNDGGRQKISSNVVPMNKMEETKGSLDVVLSVHVYSVEPKSSQSDVPESSEVTLSQISGKLWDADTEHAREMQKGVQNPATENLKENRTSLVGCGQELVVAAAKAIEPAAPRAVFKKKDPPAPTTSSLSRKDSNSKKPDSKTGKSGTMKSFFAKNTSKPKGKEHVKEAAAKKPEKEDSNKEAEGDKNNNLKKDSEKGTSAAKIEKEISQEEKVMDWLEEDQDGQDKRKDDEENEVKESQEGNKSPQQLMIKKGQKRLHQRVSEKIEQASSDESEDEMEWDDGVSTSSQKNKLQKTSIQETQEPKPKEKTETRAQPSSKCDTEVISVPSQSSEEESSSIPKKPKETEVVNVSTQSSEEENSSAVVEKDETMEDGNKKSSQASEGKPSSKPKSKRPAFAATPPEQTKRKIRKKVQKTKTDDKGYMVVYDEWVEVSADEDEEPVQKQQSKGQKETKQTVKKTERKKKQAKKATVGKQSSMLSFFSKK